MSTTPIYCIGTVAGPHPYPTMVRDFQSVIGSETRAQMQEAEGRLPDMLVACIGGGSNAIGLFHPFLDDPGVEIIGVEAAGHGLDATARGIARRRPAGRAARQAHLSACWTTTARSRTRIRSRPGSIIPASARSMPGCTIPAA